MEFIICNLTGEIVTTNIKSQERITQLLLCDKESEILENGTSKIRRGCAIDSKYKLYLCCDDQNITNKIFKHYFRLFKELANEIILSMELTKSKESQKTRRLKHNLINYNANIQQELYKLLPQILFKNEKNHLDIIENIVNKSSKKSAFAFLKILKNSNLMKNEFDVYEMLDQENPYLDFSEHPIHKVVLLTLNPFWLDIVENGVNINIQSFYGKTTLDYKTMSVSLSHIFDNITKYILPNSDLNISFEDSSEYIKLIFDMISLRVEESELGSIFTENISGKWSKETDLAGSGIGMFIVKRLILLNKGAVIFKPLVDKNKSVLFENVPYDNNIIEIKLNKNCT